jgi:hypothetical protein
LAAPQLHDIVIPLPGVPVKGVELMSWITLVTVLVVWPVVGLGVAYLFGRFIHGVEVSQSASDLAPPVVSHLRHVKRARTPSRAATQTKARREAAGGRRFH